MQIELQDRGLITRQINGALIDAINSHGVITHKNYSSASKRIYKLLTALTRKQLTKTSIKAENTLLPCPFCAGVPTLTGGGINTPHQPTCILYGQYIPSSFTDANKWNTRAQSPSQPSNMKEFEQVAEKIKQVAFDTYYKLADLPILHIDPVCKIIEQALTETHTSLIQRNEELEKELCRRIYYQDIVYDVCGLLDRAFKNHVSRGTGIVCGHANEPSKETQDSLKKLISERDTLLSLLEKAESIIASLLESVYCERAYEKMHKVRSAPRDDCECLNCADARYAKQALTAIQSHRSQK